ncbi:MAG: disulfide oxidoreductase [Alphaproteobacteria bacterium]|nr:disulfide oxidoreductase [Alphaproteobacteria bacterium]
MVMGADTIRPLLKRLVPRCEIISRPRFSRLTWSGARKLSRLPPRSAVVGFSAERVYAIAEFLRRQRGGAAVVLGALSPRTRNAQVAMFQSGEVDFLVATDAIGMGLNMDVDHVAFADRVKFDGRAHRRLEAVEIGQIAGRAGRHMNEGSFGVTAELEEFEPELIERIENHRFPELTRLAWRNAALEFGSVGALQRSLEARPVLPGLVRMREAEDQAALRELGREAEIAALAVSPDRVRLLWEVCRIPDFRKTMFEAHLRLLGRIYRHLAGPEEKLPADWVADQIQRLDRVEGDVDTLVARLAHVRSWTYISHRPGWIADARHWQEQARAVEDRLSDALHARLAQRFVDRHAARLGRGAGAEESLAFVDHGGNLIVAESVIGRVEGFRLAVDAAHAGPDSRRLRAAAMPAVRAELAMRVAALENEDDDEFLLEPDGAVRWREAVVARLEAGPTILRPGLKPIGDEALDSAQRERVRVRLAAWIGRRIENVLAPLVRLAAAELPGGARGVAFRLAEAGGTIRRGDLHPPRPERKALQVLGAVLGDADIFLPALLKPRRRDFLGLLWTIKHGGVRPTIPAAAQRVARETGAAEGVYAAMGFRGAGAVLFRLDLLQRLAIAAARFAQGGPVMATAQLAAAAGWRAEDLAVGLATLGYRPRQTQFGISYAKPRRSRTHAAPAGDTPFGALRALIDRKA